MNDCDDTIKKIDIIQGEDAPITINLTTTTDCTTTPFNLTDATEIEACFFKQDDDEIATLVKKFTVPPEVTKVGEPKLGTILIKLLPADTLLLKLGEDQDFEVKVVSPAAGTKIAKFKRKLNVEGSICPIP